LRLSTNNTGGHSLEYAIGCYRINLKVPEQKCKAFNNHDTNEPAGLGVHYSGVRPYPVRQRTVTAL